MYIFLVIQIPLKGASSSPAGPKTLVPNIPRPFPNQVPLRSKTKLVLRGLRLASKYHGSPTPHRLLITFVHEGGPSQNPKSKGFWSPLLDWHHHQSYLRHHYQNSSIQVQDSKFNAEDREDIAMHWHCWRLVFTSLSFPNS